MSGPTESRVRAAVKEAFHQIAPEVDLERVDPGADLREEADLDSVDLVNLVVLLHEALGVDIPETEYDQISTLDGMIRYLAARVPK